MIGQSWIPLAPFQLTEVLELPDWTQGEMRLDARETSVQAHPKFYSTSIDARLQAPQTSKRERCKLHVAILVSTRAHSRGHFTIPTRARSTIQWRQILV